VRFRLEYSEEAGAQRDSLERAGDSSRHWKAARKALGLMETNLRHPSLNTHKYDSITGERGEEVFESYAENNTPGAYRIFWHYGPGRGVITVVAIVRHPSD
jgi:hypothetical protein